MSAPAQEPDRRPSSATSYGVNPRHASFSSAAASSSGVSSSGINSSINSSIIINSGIHSSNAPITEATTKMRRPPRPPPVHIAQSIHPGMEIFSHDTGRSPDAVSSSPSRGYLSNTPALSPYTPRDDESRVIRDFSPSTAFLVTRTGTPGIGGSSTPRSSLRNRGWEIRDVTQQQQLPARPRRIGTGGVGGRNVAAEAMLDRVTDGIFGSWGAWIDTGSQISVSSSSPWRRSLDTPTQLSPTPSTSSFFAHFRDRQQSIHQPQALESAASLPPLPPDPTYVTLKSHPASSKSTFYSIETSPPTSSSHPQAISKQAYPSETGRIPISQWKVPYSVKDPSIITLLNNDNHHHHHHHHHGSHRGSKSGTLEQYTPDNNVRSQYFVMDKSTYTWEYKTRPKLRVPISIHNRAANNSNNPLGGIGRASSVSSGGSRFTAQAFGSGHAHPSSAPSNQTTFNGLPPSPVGGAYPLSVGLSLSRSSSTRIFPSFHSRTKIQQFIPESKTVKFRSEVLVLVKETADGFRHVVGEYHFLKCVKTKYTTMRTYAQSPTTSRLRNIISSAAATPPASPTPSETKLSPAEKHTPLGNHQSGILLLDHRSVNTIIAINSLLIALKRERQRKLVTLGMSNRGVVHRKGWGYGISQSPVNFSGGSEVDVVGGDEGLERDGGETATGGDWRGDGVSIMVEGLGIAQEEEDGGIGRYITSTVDKQAATPTVEVDHGDQDSITEVALEGEDGSWSHLDRYSLRADDWVWNGDGWVRKGPGVTPFG
ncbi:hypothetical protein DFH27DRAFT_520775 [Peziza echinospora]|nr:hypothetical protein DFH27DRAFT_520775 [Peziza echinospora]